MIEEDDSDEEEWDEDPEEERMLECGESCSHYDSLNCCCWQATEKGLCFPVQDGDYCHLGYRTRG